MVLEHGDRELKAEAVKAEFVILLKKEKFEEVLKKAEEMTKANEYDFIAWLFKSAALVALGSREEAVVALSKSIELMPEIAAIWRLKGLALGTLERHEEALEAVSKSLALNPKYADARAFKGLIEKNEKFKELFKLKNLSVQKSYYQRSIGAGKCIACASSVKARAYCVVGRPALCSWH